jgi:hypothetical protein
MRRRPIGQILVERNEISEADLAAALAEQKRTGLRLGQILIETGRISWLALARAIAEQVLDLEDAEAEGAQPAGEVQEAASQPSFAPVPEPAPPPALQPSRLPPIPQLPAPEPPPSVQFVPRRPAPEPEPVAAAPQPEPATVPPQPVPVPADLSVPELEDPALKLQSVEVLLKERQRAFIELVTTTETLRMKVARLEEIIEERDRELTKLRIARAV